MGLTDPNLAFWENLKLFPKGKNYSPAFGANIRRIDAPGRNFKKNVYIQVNASTIYTTNNLHH